MSAKLITQGIITLVFLALSAQAVPVYALETSPSNPKPATPAATAPQAVTAPLAAKLADDATTRVKPSSPQTSTESQPADQPAQNTLFYSEKKQHALSEAQLKKFNNFYLASLPKQSDLISPIIQTALAEHYDLFLANYVVQSPLIWTGDILAGWGMLPHSGGSSRAEFFIHRNGQALVVVTVEAKQFHFGAKALLDNAYVAQELATSAQAH